MALGGRHRTGGTDRRCGVVQALGTSTGVDGSSGRSAGAGNGKPTSRTRRRHPGRLPGPVLGGRPRRAARAGRRHADRDPFRGRADRQAGRPAVHDRSHVPTRSSSPRRTPSSRTAQSRLTLANSQLVRAQSAQAHRFRHGREGRPAHGRGQSAAQAAIDDAKAQIRDARFDLEYCRIAAPFTGRIGAHLVSIGSLVAGSRGASSPTTLLATMVSLDPIHLDFDMSEADYLTFSRERAPPSRVRSPTRSRSASATRTASRQAGYARLRRQRARPLERHDPCPRHGRQSRPVP